MGAIFIQFSLELKLVLYVSVTKIILVTSSNNQMIIIFLTIFHY